MSQANKCEVYRCGFIPSLSVTDLFSEIYVKTIDFLANKTTIYYREKETLLFLKFKLL